MSAMCKEYDMCILHRTSKVFTNKELWRGEEKGEVMIENNRTYYECEYCGKISQNYEEIKECEEICKSISN